MPLPPWLAEFDAPDLLAVDAAKLSANLIRARRGAAAGPSGATCEHMRVLLDDEDCCGVPGRICLGRMVALQKPAGGVWAFIMGDVFRRLVSRTLAQFSAQLQEACAPFQDHQSRYGSAGTSSASPRSPISLPPWSVLTGLEPTSTIPRVACSKVTAISQLWRPSSFSSACSMGETVSTCTTTSAATPTSFPRRRVENRGIH